MFFSQQIYYFSMGHKHKQNSYVQYQKAGKFNHRFPIRYFKSVFSQH